MILFFFPKRGLRGGPIGRRQDGSIQFYQKLEQSSSLRETGMATKTPRSGSSGKAKIGRVSAIVGPQARQGSGPGRKVVTRPRGGRRQCILFDLGLGSAVFLAPLSSPEANTGEGFSRLPSPGAGCGRYFEDKNVKFAPSKFVPLWSLVFSPKGSHWDSQ